MYQQMTLDEQINFFSPLAERMRPRNLDEYFGQEEILGKGRPLRRMIESDSIPSMIFWGNPGIGKTTLALLIAKMTHAEFRFFSAVESGIKEIKNILTEAKDSKMRGIRTIVFVDEIHRFNKLQQDAFLPDVEKGNIVLIGATTENPSFEVNSALLSRMMVVALKELNEKAIIKILENALSDKRGLGEKNITISSNDLECIASYSHGDARTALNLLEIVSHVAPYDNGVIKVNTNVIKECVQQNIFLYSKKGDEHYNIISALHKSMRNSDCDAALYWLARMLEAGEDPLYIARRLIRFASEDIGLAQPDALQQAIAAYNAAHYIGVPECSVNLAQAVVYLTLCPKSNSLYMAYEKAKDDALNTLEEGVPLQLRNAPTKVMKDNGYGEGYKYAYLYENNISDMKCLPERLCGRTYYEPSCQGEERKIRDIIENINNLRSNNLEEK